MTTEERVNEYYWWVLEKIKVQLDTTPSSNPIRYELSHVAAVGVPNNETEANIIRKLEELNAIQIIKEFPRESGYSHRHIFELMVTQPKFEEYYQKYQPLKDRATVSNNSALINFDDIPVELLQATRWVLREIKKDYVATATGEQIHILFKGAIRFMGQPKTTPDIEEQRRAVGILEKTGAIKVSSYTYPESKPGYYIRPRGALLYVLQPMFDKIYQKLETIESNKLLHSSSKPQLTPLRDEYDQLVNEIRSDDKSLEKKYNKLLSEVRLASSKITTQEQSTPESTVKPTTSQMDEIYYCGSLVINISAATLKYKDNPAVDIQPQNREIKFLVMLMRNKRVVKYSEIATEIESTSFGEEVIARAVQYLKRDLKPILKKAGMTDEEIKKMIKPVINTGYKIVCPQ